MDDKCKNGLSILCGDILCSFCFYKSFMSHEKSSFILTLDNLLLIKLNSLIKYNFICTVCLHVFIQSPYEIVIRKSWCPYCSNPPKKLCDIENCTSCFNKSFASHEKSKYLIDNVNPRFIFKGTGKKYNFRCNLCNHLFCKIIGSITVVTSRNSWCPYCSNPPKLLCEDNNCNICFNKSFASHEKSKYLIDNINPRFIFKSSCLKLNFKCDICEHNYNTSLNVATTQDIWCPYCTTSKLCDDNNCNLCFENSFASQENSKYLIDDIDPRTIFKSSGYEYNFKCNTCKNEFKSAIYRITNGSWCPICKNKTEKIMFKYLNNIYEITFHPKFNWCKNKTYLPFDFLAKEYNLLIELDGNQHFIQVMDWKSPDENFKTDIYKMEMAIKNKYSIIRIRQHDFKFSNFNWKKLISKYIKKYDEPTIIFIAKNIDIYKKFINEFFNKCIIIQEDNI